MKPIETYKAMDIDDLERPSEDQKYPIGLELCFVDPDTQTTKKFKYIQSHDALTQYQPYIFDHTGIQLKTGAPATGHAQLGVPQIAFTSGYYGFVQCYGESTVLKTVQTYAVGDHLEILNAGTALVVDGTSGATVQSAKSVGVSMTAGTTAQAITAFLFGYPADIAAT